MLASTGAWYSRRVERASLLEFFHDFNTWPRTESELSTACAWLSKLTGAPFAALYQVESTAEPRAAFRTGGADQAEKPNTELVREFLRRQLSQLSAETGQIRHVQIARDAQSPA